jgi:hypothetical protein
MGTAIIVLNGLTAALTAAPQVTILVQKAKDFFTTMAGEGLITKDQQDALHNRVDQIVEAAAEGRLPAAWSVEPDPE